MAAFRRVALPFLSFVWFFSSFAVHAQSLPAKLSETGLFSDLQKLEISRDGQPYEVNVPFFSDGASKRRWIFLPKGGRARFSEEETWDLPLGSKLVKHMELPGESRPIRVETRVLVREAYGWRGYSYQWNAAQTEAELNDDGGTAEYRVRGKTQTWVFPNRFDCFSCHQAASGTVLGIRTAQLNREVDGENQIVAWSAAGRLDRKVETVAGFLRLPDPGDLSLGLEERARSYLDANCSYCHNPRGGAPMDLRAQVPTDKIDALRVPVMSIDPAFSGMVRVLPGVPEKSLLWLRMALDGPAQMPPSGRTLSDAEGAGLVANWIRMLR